MDAPDGISDPFGRSFLSARWRWLAMLNYGIDAEVLAPYVPRGTELDTWEGESFVSVVGFLFEETRVFGLPIPFHRNFEEVNLRFYVRHWAEGEWRRGVVFVREIVPRRMVEFVARGLYNENYVTRRMAHRVDVTDDTLAPGAEVEYTWDREPRAGRIAATVDGAPYLPEAGSHAAFIIEHYWGYVRQRDGGTKEYRVEHVPWRAWECSEAQFEADVDGLYGSAFGECLTGPATSALVAEGSQVTVYAGRRVG